MSIPKLRFLLDENVRAELTRLLKAGGYDVLLAPRSVPDSKLAAISKREQRILVTNDSDFEAYTKSEIYSVVLLKIPQNDPVALSSAFKRLLNKGSSLETKFVILRVKDEDILPLPTELRS